MKKTLLALSAMLFLLLAATPAQAFHVWNSSGSDRYAGWVRRAIDWKPSQRSGVVDGCRFVLGKELIPGELWHLDVHVNLRPNERRTLDFSRIADDVAEDAAPRAPPIWPRIAGVPLLVRSIEPNGAGLDFNLRTRIGQHQMLVVDLWGTIYPGQTWIEAKLGVHCSNITRPDKVGVVPRDFALTFGDGAFARTIHTGWNQPILPEGMTIAQAQAFPAMPCILALPGGDINSANAAANWSICALGLNELWPGMGNPLWHPNNGSATSWTHGSYARVKRSVFGWELTPHTFASTAAQVSGGEPDQWAVGGPLTQGQDSLGADQLYWMLGASMARRPGMWSSANGDRLPVDVDGLAMFESYPFARGGSTEFLGLTNGNPTTLEARGWWCWREHMFYNGLFVAYRVTGCPALQWQIERRATTYLHEHTTGPFTTTPYTGSMRGYGWSALLAWWLHHTVEDTELRTAVGDRWRWRWENVGKPRYAGKDYWWVSDDPRLGGGLRWGAWQQGAVVGFVDMAGEAFGVPEARQAALRGARAVIDQAYEDVDGTLTPFANILMQVQGVDAPPGETDMEYAAEMRDTWQIEWAEEKEWGEDAGPPELTPALPISAHYPPWGGVTAWMVNASATVLRHEPENVRARALVDRDVATNRVGGTWIAPDVIAR